jgi:hypothetical protein
MRSWAMALGDGPVVFENIQKTSGEQRNCGVAEKERNDKNQNPEGNSTLPEFLEPGRASLTAGGCNISHGVGSRRVRKIIVVAT